MLRNKLAAFAAMVALSLPAKAQFVTSPEVSTDRHITFRIAAPKAQSVSLNAGDIPGAGNAALTKAANGVWEVTVGPVAPGAYRYLFQVDGVSVIDPRSPEVSESSGNSWSVVAVPGSEWMDCKEVPHGAVASLAYYSKALGRTRRMHVYTPPGYEKGGQSFPVFYLLHGAGDSDDSWTSVGRANFILDNLIAAGKAKPMIVVMPAGHTRSFTFGQPLPPGVTGSKDMFLDEFAQDIVPTVEHQYRALTGRQNRAIAGLSMGGGQSLNLLLAHPDMFSAVGVFSSGLFGAFPLGGQGGSQAFETAHKAELEAPAHKALKLLWFSTGKDDFLLQTTHGTVDMFKRHGFNVTYEETSGSHMWLNWRDYLIKFAPQLFR